MSEADEQQTPPGLPEPLPDGERLIWQRSPEWRPYSRRVFQFNRVAVYFLILLAWIVGSAYAVGGELSAALRALAWSAPPALAVLAVLAVLGWLYARTTIYTVTDKRVVIQSGLAFPGAINLPFARIESADLRAHADGTGDIELALGGERLLYSMLWPNLRMLRIGRPRPVLRALSDPEQAAESLGRVLNAHHESAPEADARSRGERSESRRPEPA